MADTSISAINRLCSFIDINGIRTRKCESGTGTPLVLIHGFTGTLCDWRANIPELSRSFSVKAFDLPGFGFSGKPLNFPYTADGYASFLISLMDRLNIEKAALAGNSMGGQIALSACLDYPDRVSALVLVDSGGYPGCVKFPLFRLLKTPVLGEAIMWMNSPLAVRSVLGSVLEDKSLVSSEAVSHYYNVYRTPNARKIPPRVIRNLITDELQMPDRLQDIKCPVLIIWGAKDRIIPVRYAHIFHKLITGSALSVIDNAGHLPQIDRAVIFNQIVIDFLIHHILQASLKSEI